MQSNHFFSDSNSRFFSFFRLFFLLLAVEKLIPTSSDGASKKSIFKDFSDSLAFFPGAFALPVHSSYPSSYQLEDVDGITGISFVDEHFSSSDESQVFATLAGDVNGDGIPDLLISTCKCEDEGAYSGGSLYLVYGGKTLNVSKFLLSNLDGVTGLKFVGKTDDCYSITTGQDISGDGKADLLIGGSGTVYLV